MSYEFHVPSTLILGEGTRSQVGQLAKDLGMNSVLIVCDGFLATLPVMDELKKYLEEAGIPSKVFSEITAEPSDITVDAGLAAFNSANCNGIISLGGGSSIDTAKSVSIAVTNGLPISNYMGYGKVPKPGVPHIAIPTTAGTGSEVTRVTVINDTVHNIKMMCLSNNIMANAAIIDYELTMSMPPSLTANVGLDALTHAIEAYVSRKANPLTDMFAEKAIRLITSSITDAYAEPGNAPARQNMMEGSMLAGVAFSNASVCTVHGMSRPIGAYFHVPHGLSNAFLLPLVTKYSLDGNYKKYGEIAGFIGLTEGLSTDEEKANALADYLIELNKKLNVTTMSGFGIDRAKYEEVAPQMAIDAIASGSPGNNPKIMTEAELVKIYLEAYAN